jgi:hypothetical protein
MFTKGKSGNSSGRPKGKQNRVTVDLRQRINEIVQNNIETIESDLQALEPKERLMILERLLSYCVPRMKSVDLIPSNDCTFVVTIGNDNE